MNRSYQTCKQQKAGCVHGPNHFHRRRPGSLLLLVVTYSCNYITSTQRAQRAKNVINWQKCCKLATLCARPSCFVHLPRWIRRQSLLLMAQEIKGALPRDVVPNLKAKWWEAVIVIVAQVYFCSFAFFFSFVIDHWVWWRVVPVQYLTCFRVWNISMDIA